MRVRNFYLSFDIDGRKTRLTGGPVGIGGEFQGTVYLRDDGAVTAPLSIWGSTEFSPETGEIDLTLNIEAEGFEIVSQDNGKIRLRRTVPRG